LPSSSISSIARLDHESFRRGAVPVLLARSRKTRSQGRITSTSPPRAW
jgi:hypothetical protein